MAVNVDGLDEAMRRMQERAERTKNLGPVLRVIGEEMRKATDDAFDKSRGMSGTPFAALAPSTLEGRMRKAKGGKRKTKSGRLTKAAKSARVRAAFSVNKPLVDTSRARNSQRAQASRSELIWSAVGYLEHHITGTPRIPKRNPTAFEGKPGAYALVGRFAKRLRTGVTRYIETGKTT